MSAPLAAAAAHVTPRAAVVRQAQRGKSVRKLLPVVTVKPQ
ncbi:hypothetical protein [Novosphingobium sp.]